MYSGVAACIVGIPLALAFASAFLAAAILLMVLVLRALNEEYHLIQGQPGYEAYRQEVRYRPVPLLW